MIGRDAVLNEIGAHGLGAVAAERYVLRPIAGGVGVALYVDAEVGAPGASSAGPTGGGQTR